MEILTQKISKKWCQDWCQIGVKNGVNVGVSFGVNTNVRIEMLLINLTGFCYAIAQCACPLIFQTVAVSAFCAVWGTQVLQAGNRCFPGFCGCFLFCSFSGVILYPESAWRCPPSIPTRSAGMNAFRRGAPSCAPASSAPVDGGRTASYIPPDVGR